MAMKTVPSNMLKPAIVISKSPGAQVVRGNAPQVLVVSSGAGIRTIQTITTQPSTTSATSTTAINLNPVASVGANNLQNIKIAGKPITITMPVSSLHGAGKPVTITKQAVIGSTGQIINVPNQGSVQVRRTRRRNVIILKLIW